MQGDKLASGARSATFSAGQADKDAPIEFHGTVATEVIDNSAAFIRELEREPKSLEELAGFYEPMNDRVLLRRVTEENKRLIQMPDAFVVESDLGVVIAVGSGMVINGQLLPIPLRLGDKVRVGHYNVEDIEVEGETLMLVSAYDVRLKYRT